MFGFIVKLRTSLLSGISSGQSIRILPLLGKGCWPPHLAAPLWQLPGSSALRILRAAGTEPASQQTQEPGCTQVPMADISLTLGKEKKGG